MKNFRIFWIVSLSNVDLTDFRGMGRREKEKRFVIVYCVDAGGGGGAKNTK